MCIRDSGRIEFDGNVLFDSEKKIDVDMHPYRKQMQMVFQDPYSSLNPCLLYTSLQLIGITKKS